MGWWKNQLLCLTILITFLNVQTCYCQPDYDDDYYDYTEGRMLFSNRCPPGYIYSAVLTKCIKTSGRSFYPRILGCPRGRMYSYMLQRCVPVLSLKEGPQGRIGGSKKPDNPLKDLTIHDPSKCAAPQRYHLGTKTCVDPSPPSSSTHSNKHHTKDKTKTKSGRCPEGFSFSSKQLKCVKQAGYG